MNLKAFGICLALALAILLVLCWMFGEVPFEPIWRVTQIASVLLLSGAMYYAYMFPIKAVRLIVCIPVAVGLLWLLAKMDEGQQKMNKAVKDAHDMEFQGKLDDINRKAEEHRWKEEEHKQWERDHK